MLTSCEAVVLGFLRFVVLANTLALTRFGGHARVRALARHRVSVKLLGDVRLERVEAHRSGLDARESEHVVGHHDVGLAEDGG